MDEKLRRAIGLADMYELMAVAWAFPTVELAVSLADGTFANDASAVLGDVGAVGAEIDDIVSVLRELGGRGGDIEGIGERYSAMRKEYSLLFLAPGACVSVFPYESAFRHRAMGASGAPALFRSPVTLDVENQMREAGVTPVDARTEPVDSVWNECTFLSYLLGKRAEAIEARDADAEARWCDAAMRFWGDHGALWLPAFMEQVRREAAKLAEEAQARPYIALAAFGSAVCTLMEGRESW